MLGDKTVYQKCMKESARVGYASPVWKWAHVKGLKESWLTIRVDKDQGSSRKGLFLYDSFRIPCLNLHLSLILRDPAPFWVGQGEFLPLISYGKISIFCHCRELENFKIFIGYNIKSYNETS